jgi:hypothetical protein
VLFRVITGQNPSQAFAPTAGTAALGAPSVGVQMLCGVVGIIAGTFGGIINSFADFVRIPLSTGPAVLVASLNVTAALAANPWLSSGNPSNSSVETFTGALILGIPAICGAYFASKKGTFTLDEQAEYSATLPFMGCFLSIGVIILDIIAFLELPNKTAIKGLAFGVALASTFPGLAGLFKVDAIDKAIDGLGKPIAGLVRMVCTLAVTVCRLILLGENIQSPLPPPPGGRAGALPA